MSEQSNKNNPNNQKRSDFRIPVAIDIYYKIRDAVEVSKDYLKMTALNISAGGFRSILDRAIEEGTFLECMILTGTGILPATARVLNSESEEGEPGVYSIRAEFFNMCDTVKEGLTKYIFAQQRKQPKSLRRRF